MKRPATILLLALFLFNLIGYKCWFYYLQQHEKVSFEAGLDKEEYKEKDLIVFKIPLRNPYQTNSGNFERVDGEISIKGTIYKYVKRKVEDGQLILLCLPYYNKMNLVKAYAAFGGHGNDLVPPGKKGGNTLSLRVNATSEYEEGSRWTLNTAMPVLILQPGLLTILNPASGFLRLTGKPPDLG